MTEVQGWIDDLEWTAQWELARALAIRLGETRAHLVQQRLQGVGWRLDGARFAPIETTDINQHAFFPAGAVPDAFVHIRTLFKGASKELFVIDGFVDSSLFQFLLSTNGPKVCRILTKSRNLPADFLAEAAKFVTQRGFALSVRSSDAFHDRGNHRRRTAGVCSGASIKDASERAFNIIPIEAPSARQTRISFRKSPFLKPGSAQNLAQIF